MNDFIKSTGFSNHGCNIQCTCIFILNQGWKSRVFQYISTAMSCISNSSEFYHLPSLKWKVFKLNTWSFGQIFALLFEMFNVSFAWMERDTLSVLLCQYASQSPIMENKWTEQWHWNYFWIDTLLSWRLESPMPN